MQDPALPAGPRPPVAHPGLQASAPLRVRVVSPGGPVVAEDLEAGLAVLRARGFEVLEGSSARHRRGYLAGDDSARMADLQEALDDPACGAVWFSRGGYGTTRLLPHLTWGTSRPPRLLCGYSDATALHLWASRFHNLIGLYAPSVTELGRPGVWAPPSLWAAVEGRPEPVPGTGPAEPAGPFPIVGGCLSLCVCSAGTAWAPNTAGCWVFLEDTGERLYRLDRMLTHLAQAGWFRAAGGVLLGAFNGLGEGEATLEVAARVRELLPAGVPVVSDIPVGHTRGKHTLPFGVPALWDGRSLRFVR